MKISQNIKFCCIFEIVAIIYGHSVLLGNKLVF